MDWPLQDAKNQLAKLVNEAQENGPQTITDRGIRKAIVLSAEEYDALGPSAPTLVDYLLSGPPWDDELVEVINKRVTRPRHRLVIYLVVTNVISDARRARPPVVRWLRSGESQSVFLSVITLGEINLGIVSLQLKDPATADRLAAWLHTLQREYHRRPLSVTNEVALAWGRISADRSRGTGDALIAATATVHRLTVVTRNAADFEDTGVSLINPWAEG